MPDDQFSRSYRSSSFYVLALIGWVALTLLALYVVLNLSISETERNFLHETAETETEVRQKLQTNEAVLSGFSAFLHAVESGDRESAMRYAAAATSPYPHIYMLEAAREVPATDRVRFEAEMRRSWEPNFALRDYAYQGARRWQEVKPKPSYWPLVFLYPDNNSVLPLYGLDLDSVPLLSQPLKDAWLWQRQSASRPFRLFEGETAYILFQSVPKVTPAGKGDSMRAFGGALTALLVVKASALRPHQIDRRDQVRAEFVVADTGDFSDIPPLFTQDAEPVHLLDTLLPSIRREVTLVVGPQTLRINFVRQLRWADLSGFSMRAVAVISLLALTLVMLYLRRHYIAMQVAEREHARAEFLAMHDPLTDLPNRHLLADRVRQALLRWQRTGAMFAMFLIDLDYFKEINDTYGHEGGDFLLKTVAHRISNTLRATDTVARYGGDEFIVLVADVLGESDARAVGEKLLSVVSEAVAYGDKNLRVTCSLGVALCPRDGVDFETLCHQADHAMYQVKKDGRNGVISKHFGPLDANAPSSG
uniref:Putative response regulator receiver modulated diguanylate cyclase/phosphodiesterase n=1 Tax=uncultured prokaryote AT3 TaxID=672202 RepID=D3W8G7_9ZZZZ|nr:putative response regulator receiver modulated diguanylate cyclase/phosphodiesterase [uncultured prokaryote AT3]